MIIIAQQSDMAYLPNIILKTCNKSNSHIPEFIFTTLKVYYDLNLQELIPMISIH